MEKVKVGIIGCGFIARNHMRQYWHNAEDAEVIACAEPDEKRRQSFAQEFNIPNAVADESELLSLPELQAVDISSPPAMHATQILQALHAGKHVLTEKPFALDFENAKKAVAEAEKANLRLMVMQNSRWWPEYKEAKRMIEEGEIGVSLFVTNQIRHVWSAAEYRKKMERMLMFEVTIHYVDLLRFVLNSEPVEVYAVTGKNPAREDIGETHVTILLKFQNECQATVITPAHCMGVKINWGGETTIECTRGTIWLNRNESHTLSAYSPFYGGYMPEIRFDPFNDFEGSIRCFVQCVVNNTEPPTSGRDNLNTLKIILTAYQSVEEKRPITLG